jgi:hypothetical protein
MLPKSIVLVIPLLLLLLHADSFGLPARDVQVITDREYFEVVHTCFKEAHLLQGSTIIHQGDDV